MGNAGCCSYKTAEIVYKKTNTSLIEFMASLELTCTATNSCRVLSMVDKDSINETIIEKDGLYVGALAYAIIDRNINMVRFLHENLGASFEIMDEKLKLQDSSTIQLIILYYDEKVLDYYLDKCFKNNNYFLKSANSMEDECTLNFLSIEIPKKKKKQVLPVMYATQKENIKFLTRIIKRFSCKQAPREFNIHSIDEDSGENCALIACRNGNLNLIAFLYKHKADFSLKNCCSENALTIALAGCACQKENVLFQVIVYLVETVKVDITYNYEETLLLARGSSIIQYLEEKLAYRGIYVTKMQIEERNNISFGYSMLCSSLLDCDSLKSTLSPIPYIETCNTPSQIIF